MQKEDNMVNNIKFRNICKFVFMMAILILSINYGWHFVYASTQDETVEMNKESIVMYIGDKESLKVNGSSEKFKWESLDENIATVDENGNVTAIGVGNNRNYLSQQ